MKYLILILFCVGCKTKQPIDNAEGAGQFIIDHPAYTNAQGNIIFPIF